MYRVGRPTCRYAHCEPWDRPVGQWQHHSHAGWAQCLECFVCNYSNGMCVCGLACRTGSYYIKKNNGILRVKMPTHTYIYIYTNIYIYIYITTKLNHTQNINLLVACFQVEPHSASIWRPWRKSSIDGALQWRSGRTMWKKWWCFR